MEWLKEKLSQFLSIPAVWYNILWTRTLKGKVHSRMIFDYLLVFNNSVSMVLFKFLKDNCKSVKLKLFENSWAPPLAAISGPRRKIPGIETK